MRFRLALVLLLLPLSGTLHAQTSAQDIEFVRHAYGKLIFTGTLGGVDRFEFENAKLDQKAFDQAVAQATPVITLSNFTSGTIASIENERWGDFATAPDLHENLTSGGLGVAWEKTVGPYSAERSSAWTNVPVHQFIEMLSSRWADAPVAYTRYVSVTADVSYQGKSSGPHRAMWLFGTYLGNSGKKTVAPIDPSLSDFMMGILLGEKHYPSKRIMSSSSPLVISWLRTNELPAGGCSYPAITPRAHRPHGKDDPPTSEEPGPDICCAHGRCGFPDQQVEADLRKVGKL